MSANVTLPNLLTRSEAAEFLGISANTLSVWASTGRYGLRFIKVGRFAKYRLSDLEAFLERRSCTQTSKLEVA